jgi:hypothetical protein
VCGDALTAAGFTHQPNDLSLIQAKAHVVNGFRYAALGKEKGLKISYFKESHATASFS